jgi:hypothetical protein
MMLYWIELTKLGGIKTLGSLKKLKSLYVILVILTFVTVLPIGIWESIEETNLSIDLFNGILALYVIIDVFFSLKYGIKFFRIIKNLWESTRNQGIKVFLTKVTIFLLWCTSLMILTATSLILYSLVGAEQIPFVYVTFHLIFRCEEFGMTSFMLISTNI